jgi:tetratricopeptide (TPR) repeat protein
LGVCIFLAAVIWAVFGQTLHYEFVNFDAGPYVYENPEVARGVTLHGICWAFTHVHSYNWHPLTWISHMLDCELYGLNPAGHHFTNVFLHTVTTILLFLLLRQMTGFLWRSAVVAAVFAIHPLRVESVAWVAERKDVLSGVFFMLTIAAYLRYVRRPWSAVRYGLVMLLFALGLMCKPMLVTLPVVLLLLDYWPLNRLRVGTREAQAGWRTFKRPILEKLPLFGLAAASCVVTIFAQTQAIRPTDQIPLSARIDNALISAVTYVGQMFWPSRLTVLYPFPVNGVPASDVIVAGILLLSISLGVFVLRKQRRYLLVGWLWYLLMLTPVIGILQVGLQAHADRYTYLPQIGLVLLLVWTAADLSRGWRERTAILGGCSAVVLAALIFCTRAQVSYWRNSASLWNRALAYTSDNFIAHSNLGVALATKGDVNEAIAQYQLALKIKPNYADAHSNLGSALLQKGNVDGAMDQLQTALQLNPNNAEAENNLGNALLQKGNVDEGIVHLQKALQRSPDNMEAHNNLGYALVQKGNVNEAIVHYQRALELARAAGRQDVVERLNAELKSLQGASPSTK